MSFQLPVWAFAYGSPSALGEIRVMPEDFVVEEILRFQPSGDGEHVFVHLQKTGENTVYAAKELARFAGVRQHDVGYAGLKDRHGITRQWFSLWLPGRAEPDWRLFGGGNMQVLASVRHARKLKRGVLAGNRFSLVIRSLRGDQIEISRKLGLIRQHGLPNYYGEQRFGNQGKNVEKALALFGGERMRREQRGIYLSAARSYLFNQILSLRVRDQTWNRSISGDVFQFDGSKSCFTSLQPDLEIKRRVKEMIIHPCGALWGKGKPEAAEEALAIQEKVIGENPELASGLCAAGLKSDRRALRVKAEDLEWHFPAQDQLQLRFTLPAGSYATALLRELVIWEG